MTGVKARARVTADVSTPAGGTERDGAAVLGHARARRWCLRVLIVEAYLMDMITRRDAAGKLIGDELPRRWLTATTAPTNEGARGGTRMSGRSAEVPLTRAWRRRGRRGGAATANDDGELGRSRR